MKLLLLGRSPERDQTERDRILSALVRAGGIASDAAELLSISERTLWYRVRRLGLSDDARRIRREHGHKPTGRRCTNGGGG